MTKLLALRFRTFIYLVALIFIGVGCAPIVFIYSEADSEFMFTPTQKIYIGLLDNVTLSEKNFYYLLRKQMKDVGLNLTDDIDSSDAIMIFGLNEKTSEIQSYMSKSTTSYTSGHVGGIKYGESTTSTSYLPYTYQYTAKIIYLDLYSIAACKNNQFTPIWSGSVGAEKGMLEKNVKACVVKLLKYYGQNYSGRVRLNKTKNNLRENNTTEIKKDSSLKGYPGPHEYIYYDEPPIRLDSSKVIIPLGILPDSAERSIWVNSLIDTNGTIIQSLIETESGLNPILEEAIKKEAMKLIWSPAKRNGKSIAVWVNYKMVISSK